MALTLDDINGMPTDTDELINHLQNRGILQRPVPPPAPEPVQLQPMQPPANTEPPAAPSPVATMKPPSIEGTAPTSMPSTAMAPETSPVKPLVPPKVGSAAESQSELENLQNKVHGDTLASHDTTLGKIGHVAARVGNIAGNILVPNVMANIPGTDLNNNIRTAGLKNELAQRTGAEEEQNSRGITDKFHQQQLENEQDAAKYDTPEKRQAYMAEKPELFNGLSDFEKNDYVLSGKFPQKEPVEPKEQTLSQLHANAVADAIKRGVNPAEDPTVQQYADSITSLQKEQKPANATEQVRTELLAAMKSGDKAKIQELGQQLEKLSDPTGEKEILRQLAMQSAQQRVSEKLEKDKSLTPAAQQIIMNTQPTLDQVDQLIAELEPLKDDNSSRLTIDRIGYALGHASPKGSLAADISKLELDRVMAGARVLKGSSRAYQALELAMKHAPNSWVDTPNLMYDKLKNIRQNLADIEEDAKKYGAKNLPANVKTGTEGAGGPTGGEAKSHNFEINGKRYENVPDALYQKAKKKPGFKE